MNILNLFKKKQIQKRENVNVQYISQRTNKYSTIKNPDTALTNSVIFRGVSILSDSVASIPIYIYRKNNKGYWNIDEKNPLYNILTRKSNNRLTIYELLEGTIIQLIMYGNAYIYIGRGANGDIKELVLLYPQTVYHDSIKNNYTVTDEYNGIRGLFNSNQIIHLKHKSLETIVGKSVVENAAKTLGLAQACDSESLSTLNSGGRLKGIISSESSVIGFGDAQDNQIQDIRSNMEDELSSGKDILTMPSGVKWQTMSQTTKDLMINENKQYTLSDLARFMGISLSKLFIAMGSNYQAAQQEQLNFYVDTLNPLLVKIEKAFNSYLIPDTISSRYKIEFDRTVLPYYKDVLSNYEKQMQLGIMSVNDIRKIHNKAETENGDKVVISTNLQYIDNPTVFSNNLQNTENQEDTKELQSNNAQNK